MNPQIQILRTPDPAILDWFVEGDMSTVALDTETMGKDWLPLYRQIQVTEDPVEKKGLELKIGKPPYSKQALDHRQNLLAVVQLAERGGRCIVALLETDEMKQWVTELLETLKASYDPVWLLANAKFDFHQLEHHLGVHFCEAKVHDVVLSEALIKGNRDDASVALAVLCETYEVPTEYGKVKMDPVCDWWQTLTTEQIEYASRDVYSLFFIMDAQKKRMEQDRLLRVRKLEHNLLPYLTRMEDEGLHFDHDKLHRFLLSAQEKAVELKNSVAATFGAANINSGQQMIEKIVQVYGITPIIVTGKQIGRAHV